MPTDRRISRVVTIVAAALTAAAVILPPSIYFSLSYQREAGSLDAEAELTSQLVNPLVGENPDLWRYEQIRFSEYLSRRPRAGTDEIRRVVDVEGRVVAESADELARPWLSRAHPLHDSGEVVGAIEISRSLRPLLLRTLLLTLVLLPLSVMAFQVLRTVPLRAIRESQAVIRRERDTAQRYLDVAGVAFVVLEPDGRVSRVNRKGAEILGRPESEVLGRDWVETFVDPPDRARVASERASVVAPGSVHTTEYAVVRPSGERREISWFLTRLPGGEGTPGALLCSGADLTVQRQLEERLRNTQKLEALGQLAGGVAHGFNNILSTVKGYAALLRKELSANDGHRADVDEILAAAERAAVLTRSLLSFSRQETVQPEPLDLVEIVKRTERLLRPILRSDVGLELRLPREPLPAMADPVELEQVLLNLVTNARDAMPEGGRVTVSAACVELDAARARAAGLDAPGRYAEISVSDTGTGIDAEKQARIFEPFFTTKEIGKGTGLGLAIAYGVVKQHRGAISVTSEPGRGATFIFLLPLLSAPAALARMARPDEGAPPGGDETLLIAEDDAALRRMLRRVLEGAGYRVIEAEDGDRAIARFRENRARIHLTILDVIMPKRNGRMVLDELRRIDPGVRAVFLSGYTDDPAGAHAIDFGKNVLVAKPVMPEELLRAVRRELDARAGAVSVAS